MPDETRNYLKSIDAREIESAIENTVSWRDHSLQFTVDCSEIKHWPDFEGHPTVRLCVTITQSPKPDEAPTDEPEIQDEVGPSAATLLEPPTKPDLQF